MSSPQKRHLSPLLLAILLLCGRTAGGAQNGSETGAALPVGLAGYPSGDPSARGIVAKEGSSTLIQCNVTGGHGDVVKWYNSKGALLVEAAGKRSTTPL